MDRITAPHRSAGGGRLGRKTGRASNRINKFVPIRYGPQAFDEPGWFEADTVSHGCGDARIRLRQRQLLGCGRFGDLELREQVNELYEKAWLPLRNHFTPVMKLVEKQRLGSKIRKKYDTPATPCDRLLTCAKVSEETKVQLRAIRAALDPMDLAADIEARLGKLFTIVERIEEDRQEEMERAGESRPLRAAAGADRVVKTTRKNPNQPKRRVS